jgi:hypothetical protein
VTLGFEREFQLAAAMKTAEGYDNAQLRACLHHAWVLLLTERSTSEELLRASSGLDVRIGGPLLPNRRLSVP